MKNTTMKKWFGKILGITMALGLCFGSSVPAMAAGEATPGTEDAPADAYLTKELQLADGVTVPDAAFTFTFEKIKEDGAAPTDAMPAITDKTITYTTADTATPDADGLVKIKKISGKILDGVTFTHAGEYEYKVKEAETGYTLVDGKETMQYSKAEYTMHVIVSNKDDGTGVYVKYVVVDRVLNDAGTAEAEKVDSGDTTGTNTFTFTNVFTRVGGGTEAGNPSPLEISKTVTGDAGDKTKEFEFELTLTKSPTERDDITSYPATITKADGTVENVNVMVGQANTFKLKHGEKLSFDKAGTYPGVLPAGTRYTVTETGANGYTTTAEVVQNGGTSETINDVTVNNKLVGDKENYAKYSNEKSSAAPTGILINNLPFILLIGGAIAAFVLYIAAKRRRSMR